MEWQLIDTAPKDGTSILVYPATWDDVAASVAKWDTDEFSRNPKPYWHRNDDFGRSTISRERTTTHWMPLPEAPK